MLALSFTLQNNTLWPICVNRIGHLASISIVLNKFFCANDDKDKMAQTKCNIYVDRKLCCTKCSTRSHFALFTRMYAFFAVAIKKPSSFYRRNRAIIVLCAYYSVFICLVVLFSFRVYVVIISACYMLHTNSDVPNICTYTTHTKWLDKCNFILCGYVYCNWIKYERDT